MYKRKYSVNLFIYYFKEGFLGVRENVIKQSEKKSFLEP